MICLEGRASSLRPLLHSRVHCAARRSLVCLGALKTSSNRKVAEKTASKWGRESRGQPSTSTEPIKADQPGWSFFDLAAYNKADFNVPWGPWLTVSGMALWFTSFVSIGFVILPGLYRLAGVDLFSLSSADRANFMITCQIVEVVVTGLILWALTRKALAENPAPTLFNFSLSNPFKAPNGWATWGLLGVVASPLVVGSVAWLMTEVGYNVGGRGTVDSVAPMIQLDLRTYLDLLATTGALAPLMEETVFRGFLLTSLTKFMPPWAAVLASSVTFGLAHLSGRDLPVLTALGVLLGFSYLRSGNLLTPILIHGAWNSTVLTLLFTIAASGLDIEKVLQELR